MEILYKTSAPALYQSTDIINMGMDMSIETQFIMSLVSAVCMFTLITHFNSFEFIDVRLDRWILRAIFGAMFFSDFSRALYYGLEIYKV